MKYIVEYELPYRHTVEIGVTADNSEQAVEKAQALFESCEMWEEDAADQRLLRDGFEEDTDAGVTPEFSVKRTLDAGEDWPASDNSVQQKNAEVRAGQAARALVNAYKKGEAAGGSVDWSDIDAAYELALKSLADKPTSSKDQAA